MTTVEVSTRRAGRTHALVMALPAENTPTVVVHSQAMADYVRQMAYELRHDLKHPIRVRIVNNDQRACDYLRGLDFVVDHAVLEHASPIVIDLLRAMDRSSRLRMERNP